MTRPETDDDLLRRYVASADRQAMDELVRRHVDFVYATARRQVGDSHMAEDVTQAVFLLLARKAGSVHAGKLPGWLFRATRYAAANARKVAARRAYHERRAAAARLESTPRVQADEPESMLARLDDALAALGSADRRAIILRYLQGCEMAEVSAAMGVGDAAGRKRVTRAVERLRQVFARKGVKTAGAAGVAAALALAAAEKAPASVVQMASAATNGAPSVAAVSISKGVSAMMTWTKIKLALAVTVALALASGIGLPLLTNGAAPQETTAGGAAPPAATKNEPAELTIKLIGPDGKPVTGAMVGNHASWSKDTPPRLEVRFWGPSRNYISDEQGRVSLTREAYFGKGAFMPGLPSPDAIPPVIIYAIAKDQSLVGLRRLTTKAELLREVEVSMEPACRVSGNLSMPGMPGLEKPQFIGITEVRFRFPRDNRGFLSCTLKEPRFEFFLPSGTFNISSHGQYGENRSSDIAHHELVIQPGQREARLDLVLPLSWHQLHLFDRPAPELREIKGWKDGKSVKLADLKGKVVLLYFWDYDDYGSVRNIPSLMELHDQYKDKGLAVINIHNNSVASIEEMEQKVAPRRVELWNGRNLPFPTALDSGAACADYGIKTFHSMILIDKEGCVVGLARTHRDVQRMIEEELKEKQ